MRTCLAALIPAVVVALPLAACYTPRGRAPDVEARPHTTAAAAWDAPTKLLVDSASVRLADLELRRVAFRARYWDWAPEVRAVDRQIAAIEGQLAGVPASEAARALALRRVFAALAGREAGLTVEREQLLVRYTEASNQVKFVDDEMRSLADRRAEVEELTRVAARR